MRWLVLALCIPLVVACSDKTSEPEPAVLTLHQDKLASVSLSPAHAPVEEILSWSVSLAEGWQIKRAQVTGLSMNMGTIPLLFNTEAGSSNVFHAEMVLGACSQPKMKWQLQLILQHATAGDKLLLLPFYSSWPE